MNQTILEQIQYLDIYSQTFNKEKMEVVLKQVKDAHANIM